MADPVEGQVTHYPFVVYYLKCLGILWVVNTRIPTFFLLLLEASQKNFAWGAQALHPFWKSGFPLCAIAVPVSEQCGLTTNQFLAHTGSCQEPAPRSGGASPPSPRGAQLTEAVSRQHFLTGLLKAVLMLQLGLSVAHLDVLELSLCCCRAGPPKTSKAAAAQPLEQSAEPP